MIKNNKFFYVYLIHTMSGLPSSFISKKSADGASATSFITRVTPIGGQTANAGDSFTIRLGGLQKNMYLATADSFLKFKLQNRHGSNHYFVSRAGVGTMFRSIIVQQAGATLSNYSEYGIKRTLDHYKTASTDFIKGDGNTLIGTEDVDTGIEIRYYGGAGGGRMFCDPLKNYGSLFNCPNSKYIPLFSKDSIDITFELGDASYAGYWNAQNSTEVLSISNQDLKLIDIELVMSVVQLSPEVTQAHAKLHNGMYVFETSSYGLNQFSFSDYSIKNLNLGLGYTNLESIDFCFLPQTDSSGVTVFDKTSNDMRSTFINCGLSKYGFLVDGSLVESTRMVYSSIPETLAMGLIKKGGFDNIKGNPYSSHTAQELVSIVAQPSHQFNGLQAVNGAWVGSLDLCVYKNGKQNIMCSGRNVLSASTQLQLEFDDNVLASSSTGFAGQQRVNCAVFSNYRQMIVLDMNIGLFTVLQ